MRFYGVVGYGETVKTGLGVWDQVVTRREYYGDVLSHNRKWEPGEHLNDDLNITNRISIVADAYAYQHFSAIRYVEWMGAQWKVTQAEVESPRIILTLGGVWNGPASDTTSNSD